MTGIIALTGQAAVDDSLECPAQNQFDDRAVPCTIPRVLADNQGTQ